MTALPPANPRGRKSRAALALVPGVAGRIERLERPPPPAGLSDAEAALWRDVTASLPAEWFRPEQLPLLAQYCRHVIRSNIVADKVVAHEEYTAAFEALPPDPDAETPHSIQWAGLLQTYDRLLKMQERESRAITTLATKMRLSQQSTYDKSKRKPLMGSRPWDGKQ